MTLRKAAVLFGAVAAGAALLAAACGGNGEEGEAPAREETPVPTAESPAGEELGPQPDPPQEVAQEVTEPSGGVIETEMGDNFFVQNNLKVRLGETVTLRAVNNGQAIHNLRIAGVDGEWDSEDDAVTDPEVVKSGETGELTFTAQVAGVYTFRCDFHPTEMGGVIVVEL